MARKSSAVRLGIVGAIAAVTIAGCGNSQQTSISQVGRCVDMNGRVLPDSACEGGTSAYAYPHWVYGGSVYYNGRPAPTGSSGIGGILRGGSTSPMSGATVVSPSGTVIRGGFGESGVGGRGGDGEGGEGGYGGEGGHGGGAGE